MSFREIIQRWPDPATSTLARDLGCKNTTVSKWRVRDSIPSEFWLSLVNAAQERGVQVTLRELAEIRQRQKLLARTDKHRQDISLPLMQGEGDRV